MSSLLESLVPQLHRAEADAADAAELAAEVAMRNLRAAQALRATLNSAGRAIDAAMRPGFDPDYGSYTGSPLDPRNSADDDNLTSLQPLGDATVMVVYSWDSNESLSIDGATIGAEFVSIENFSNHVRGMWEKAIRAEEAKDAEISEWGE